VNFSDDGAGVYSGSERMALNPQGRSTYTADVRLTGAKSGAMELQLTFGPIGDELPAYLVFDKDDAGKPLTHGYAEYDGQRLTVDTLVP
jgi:hypothetical protein